MNIIPQLARTIGVLYLTSGIRPVATSATIGKNVSLSWLLEQKASSLKVVLLLLGHTT